ncbi:MAG: tRNA lysidine(34) synthetase TilS [Ginsengibacter sp.]
MKSLSQDFTAFIQRHNLFGKKDDLLLAVSGGLDSVVLCELCHQAGYSFSMAHCNFQLRGEESDRDEKFVRALGQKYKVAVFVRLFDTIKFAESHKVSIEMAARELRYAWFNELIKEQTIIFNSELQEKSALLKHTHSKDTRWFLLTAHHADDNVETLLMNFFKGTGIKGLHGILPKKNNLLRPLLFAKKEELLAFAKDNSLSYVDDSTNFSDEYLRNYFRNQLIPGLEKVFPKVKDNLQKNIERFGEIEILYQQSVDFHKKNLIEIKGNEIHIPVLKLLKAKPLRTILYEVIKEYGFKPNQTNEVIPLLNSETGKYISSATHLIFRNRAWLIIAPLNPVDSKNILIDTSDGEFIFEQRNLKLKKKNLINIHSDLVLNYSENVALLDAASITFPLLLRKWKQGDYFYPLGMKHKKKLSKFFIDQKISMTDKEKIWVIESNKRIIWVVGKRIDDRFKISVNTKEILHIEVS